MKQHGPADIGAEFAKTAVFATTGDPLRYDLRAIRRAIRPLKRLHTGNLQSLYGYCDRFIRLLLKVLETLEKEEVSSINSPTYPFVLAVLSSKCIGHIDSLRILVNAGRYGQAAVINRLLLSDVLMGRYLLEFPDAINDWAAYARARANLNNAERRRRRARFEDGAIRRQLEEIGAIGQALGGLYRTMSEPAHSSLWGAHLYLQRIDADSHEVTYSPNYDLIRANELVGIALTIFRLHFHSVFLWIERRDASWGLRFWKRYLRLDEELQHVIDDQLEILDSLYENVLKAQRGL